MEKSRLFTRTLPLRDPPSYAQPDQGVDFDTGSRNVTLSSTSGSPPQILKSVTATCPVNGFLFATAASAFSANTSGTSAKLAVVNYSIAKDTAAIDPTTFNALRFFVPLAPSGTSGLASAAGSAMWVDSCTARQSVTYHFTARREGLTAEDTVQAVRPKLVVTFFEQRI